MKKKNMIRILSLLLACICSLSVVGMMCVSAEAGSGRDYSKVPTNGLYLTYDEATGKPGAYYHKSSHTGISDGGNATYSHYSKYLTGEDCATPEYSGENGFLKIKPDVVGKPMAIRISFGVSWDILTYEICKYTSLCYKVVGDESAAGKVMHAGALAGDDEGNLFSGNAYFDYPISAPVGGWSLATQETTSKSGENNGFQFWNLDQKKVEFVVYLPALDNSDAYYVLDYVGWTASEADTNAMKAEHDEWTAKMEKAELEKIFSVTNTTRAERGIARENVLYFDGYSADHMTAGYCYSGTDGGLMNAISGNIQFVNPGPGAYDSFTVGVTDDGHIRLTLTEKIYGGAVLVKTPVGFDPQKHGTVVGMRYKVEKADGSAMVGEITDLADGSNPQDRSTGKLTWAAGTGWQHAIGTFDKTSSQSIALWLPEELRVAGTEIILDYFGFFADEQTAKEEFKIQSVADGVDVGFAGVQTKLVTGTDGTETRSLRFVGTLDDYQSEAYGNIGFELTQNGTKNKKPIVIQKVYRSITAAGETVTAESLGNSYLFTFCLDGLELRGKEIAYTVTPYAYVNGKKVTGRTVSFNYTPKTDTFSAFSIPEDRYEETVMQNTYYKLAHDKQLNVAYIGGSITEGAFADPNTTAYAKRTSDWLARNFPGAKINHHNAGIGGTGSFYGVYRAAESLKLNDPVNRPDLVFIEYAVNDGYDDSSYENVVRYGESLIQEIYRCSPYADIVILVTIEKSGTHEQQRAAWADIGARHQIPVVKLGEKIFEVINQAAQQNGTSFETEWSVYYGDDFVHPNVTGHAKFAEFITDYLQAELVDKILNPDKRTEKIFGQPMTDRIIDYPVAYSVYDMPFPNFEKYSSTNILLEPNKGLQTGTAGSEMKISFTGTGVQLDITKQNTGVVLEYSIDGGDYRELRITNQMAIELAYGLEYGTHTVSVRIKSLEEGSVFQIRRFMIAGDRGNGGITAN